jgi:hypothetical protein
MKQVPPPRVQAQPNMRRGAGGWSESADPRSAQAHVPPPRGGGRAPSRRGSGEGPRPDATPPPTPSPRTNFAERGLATFKPPRTAQSSRPGHRPRPCRSARSWWRRAAHRPGSGRTVPSFSSAEERHMQCLPPWPGASPVQAQHQRPRRQRPFRPQESGSRPL